MTSVLLAFITLVGNKRLLKCFSRYPALACTCFLFFPISLYGVSLSSLDSLEFFLLCLGSCIPFFVKFVVPHRGFRVLIFLLASPRVSTTVGAATIVSIFGRTRQAQMSSLRSASFSELIARGEAVRMLRAVSGEQVSSFGDLTAKAPYL